MYSNFIDSHSAAVCTVAHQAPLSVGFSSQEYWTGLPCTPPGDLPDSGIESMSFMSPALTSRLFTIINIVKIFSSVVQLCPTLILLKLIYTRH